MPTLAGIPPPRRPELLLRPLGDRGQFVVKDPRSGAYFRLGEREHFLLARLDGEQTAAAIRRTFADHFGEALTEEDLDDFLGLAAAQGFLHKATAEAAPEPEEAPSFISLLPSYPVTTGELDLRDAEETQRRAPARAAVPKRPGARAGDPPAPRPRQSILYWRTSVFDPDRLFSWLAPKLWFLWTPAFVVLSLAGITTAAVVVWSNFGELVSQFAGALRWETALVVWLTLVAATTLHEFAHGLTCKHHGGEVHEVGFLLMFFLPCFYCNVSDAWLIREKSKRLWVTLAGGYCDLCLWALAVFAWRVTLPDGLPNYAAWVVLSVLGARVFFNFNPLLKLDGYYLLSDWKEVPNLQQRGWDRAKGHTRRLLWGAPRPTADPRGGFLTAYGLASWLFALVFLVLMLFALFRFLWACWGPAALAVVVPLGFVSLRGVLGGLGGGEVRRMILMRRKRSLVWLMILAGAGSALVLVQVEDQAGGPFQVRPAVRAEVRAPAAGFLREAHFDEGDRVSPGAVVARLEVPDLASRSARARAEAREAEAGLRLLQAGARAEALAEQRLRVARAGEWRDLAAQHLRQARQALREELARLDEQAQQCAAELRFAQEAFDRVRGLRGKGAVTEEQGQEVRKKLEVCRSHVEEARAKKRALEAVGTREAESELTRRAKGLADAEGTLTLLEAGARPEEVEAARARLARAEAEVVYLEGLEGRLVVRCPVGGLVTTPRLKEKVGQYVREGELICQVEAPEALEVEILIAEQDAARVRPGLPVELKARALPFQTFSARVSRVAPAAARPEAGLLGAAPRADVPGTVSVYCRLDGAGPDLRPGMTGHARVSAGPRPMGEVLHDRVLRVIRTEFWW